MNKKTRDVVFDALAERFSSKIYGSQKGELRLTLLWEDLLKHIPHVSGGHVLNVLDIGGGLGHMSIKFAQAGHQVLMCEPSQNMLDMARLQINSSKPLAGEITLSQSSMQALAIHDAQEKIKCFDMIVCHAVLEWLADPLPTFALILDQLKPGAYISLAFYNKESIVWKNLLKGNVKRAMSNRSGEEGGLTPQHPQSPQEVLAFLNEYKLRIVNISGIRCLSDYLYPQVKMRSEDLLSVERALSQKEPYKWLGRYIHVVAQKPF